MAMSNKNSKGVITLIGPIGAALALIVGVIALVIGFGASGSASDNTDALAAAQAELTRTKSELATTSQSLASLDSAYNQAQSALAVAQSAVQATLASLDDGQSGLKDFLSVVDGSLATAQGSLNNLTTDVGNVERELADNKDDISAQADTIRDVDRSLDALKNSFTLTRDDVVANKGAVAELVSTSAQNANLTKYLVVDTLLRQWLSARSTSAHDSPSRERLRAAVQDTTDSGVISAHTNLLQADDAYLANPTATTLATVNSRYDDLNAVLSSKISDAR